MRQKIGMTLLAFAPLALFGARVTPLPTLPCGELPNSEVVTNVVLNVDYGRLENLTFSLELNASASNSLSIAVGTAAGDALTLDDKLDDSSIEGNFRSEGCPVRPVQGFTK